LKKVLKKRTYYYLNFASTYRFPSLYEITNNYTNDLLNISANLKPEQKSAFELGYKSKRNPKVGESSYDLNTSFFYYSYLNKMKNIIISAAASQFIVNSDKAEIFGFDSELTLIPSVNWISFKILFSNYFYSDASFFPMQPNRVFKNIISFKTRLIKVDIINRNEGEKIVSSLKEDGSIIENKLDPALGFDCNISKNFNYKFLKFSVSMNGKNLLSEKTSINGISIYDKRYYLKINVKV
jgi:hypothetical protein